MTYEQILKEFDEKIETYDKDGGFIVYVEGYDNQDFDVDLIKSFLKQSFIKYLKDEVERLEKSKKDEFNPDVDGHIPFAKTMRITGYNQAISDQITHLQAQIKELEA